MKRTILIGFLVIANSISALAQTRRSRGAQVDRELRRLTRLWDEALVRKDMNAIGHILADDFVLSGLSKAQYSALLKILDTKYESAKKHEIKVRVYGNTAVLYGRSKITGRYTSADSFSSVFDFMDVWVKQTGRWRCVAEFSNRIRDESQEEEKMVPIGADVRADVLIYSKTNVGYDGINQLYRNVLNRPRPDGRGYDNPPEVRTVLRISPVQGHEGIAITFFPAATNEQRDALKRAITASPIVHKILENRAPADVKKID